ncbi:MAG: hypothetical protein KW802_01260 [Candidatus Doudnabacteria bacterium]|nr:hypothetical protein [Candidatus Doudnabacteria bacterium]
MDSTGYQDTDLTSGGSTTSKPPVAAAPTPAETTVETKAQFWAGVTRGLFDANPHRLFAVIVTIGFILIAFSGHMERWFHFFSYLSFIAAVIIYFGTVGFIDKKASEEIGEGYKRILKIIFYLAIFAIVAGFIGYYFNNWFPYIKDLLITSKPNSTQ